MFKKYQWDAYNTFTLICKLNNFITQNADKIDENTNKSEWFQKNSPALR